MHSDCERILYGQSAAVAHIREGQPLGWAAADDARIAWRAIVRPGGGGGLEVLALAFGHGAVIASPVTAPGCRLRGRAWDPLPRLIGPVADITSEEHLANA